MGYERTLGSKSLRRGSGGTVNSSYSILFQKKGKVISHAQISHIIVAQERRAQDQDSGLLQLPSRQLLFKEDPRERYFMLPLVPKAQSFRYISWPISCSLPAGDHCNPSPSAAQPITAVEHSGREALPSIRMIQD